MKKDTEADRIRILRWISNEGGTITRHRLRRFRPGKARWQPVAIALQGLLDDDSVQAKVDLLEPMIRGCGYPATRYVITRSGIQELRAAIESVAS